MKLGLFEMKNLVGAAALALSVVGGSSAMATTIDFTTLTPGVITGPIWQGWPLSSNIADSSGGTGPRRF